MGFEADQASTDSPVRSSTSENLGALHILQVWRRAQFTFAHLLHCQSSALNKPRDLSAAALPISVPSFFLLELLLLLLLPLPRSRSRSRSLSRSGLSLPSRSRSHLLHCKRRAKFRWRQLQNRGKCETRRTSHLAAITASLRALTRNLGKSNRQAKRRRCFPRPLMPRLHLNWTCLCLGCVLCQRIMLTGVQVILLRPQEQHLTDFFYQYYILYTVRNKVVKTSIPLSIVWLPMQQSIGHSNCIWGTPKLILEFNCNSIENIWVGRISSFQLICHKSQVSKL